MNTDSVAHDQDGAGGPAVLTAEEVSLVSGAVKVELDIPPHIFVPLMIDHYVRTALILAPMAPIAVGAAAMGLFDAWAEQKLSTARKSS